MGYSLFLCRAEEKIPLGQAVSEIAAEKAGVAGSRHYSGSGWVIVVEADETQEGYPKYYRRGRAFNP